MDGKKILLLILGIVTSSAQAVSHFSHPPSLETPPWPAWAHQHWVWENEGDENSAWDLVEGYERNQIPVRAIIIDRPWDTAPSTFVPDPTRYPNMRDLIQRFHAKNIKVILWSVSSLNQEAPEFMMAKLNGFFVNHGRLVKWWGGKGALLDYQNRDAVAWWHERMNIVLDMGIDGWKLDAIDPYIVMATADTNLVGYGKSLWGMLFPGSKARRIWDQYKNSYYSDYLEYSRRRTGKKFVVSARPVDRLAGTQLSFPFAPFEASFAGWVGDQSGDWNGLRLAISNMKKSADQEFLSFGSDIGGFITKDPDSFVREKELFIRWVQLSAFNSVFENGGSGEHRPWMYDQDTLDLYRDYTEIHEQLVPYIYSSAAWAYEAKHSVYVNTEKLGIKPKEKGEWNFLLGPNVFVASIDRPGQKKTVLFPPGEWVSWFNPAIRIGDRSLQKIFPLDQYPAYLRVGSLVPLQGTQGIEVLILPKIGVADFPLYSETSYGTKLQYQYDGKNLIFTTTNSRGISKIKLPIWPEWQHLREALVQGRPVAAQREGQWVVISLESCEEDIPCSVQI